MVVGIVVVLAVLAVAGYFVAISWSRGQQASNKNNLQQGYAQHPLSSPFTQVSQIWNSAGGAWASTGTWTYNYRANVAGPAAVTAVAQDLSLANGYQVIATSPDQITSSGATLHRDLITGNDTLTVVIAAAQPGSYAKGPVAVTVTLSDLSSQ
jgi:type II secretory pathway pseudopilin PulG